MNNTDNLTNKLSGILGSSPNEIKNSAQNGDIKKLLANLPPERVAQIQKILSDESATKKILSSPQAQEIMKGLDKK